MLDDIPCKVEKLDILGGNVLLERFLHAVGTYC